MARPAPEAAIHHFARVRGVALEAIDLLDKMLDMNQKTRIKVGQALEHPFLENLHDPEDEPVFEGTIDFSFETDPSLDLVKIQRLIIKEIAYYNPEYLRFMSQEEPATPEVQMSD